MRRGWESRKAGQERENKEEGRWERKGREGRKRAGWLGKGEEYKTRLRVPTNAYAHRPRALLDIGHEIEERHLDTLPSGPKEGVEGVESTQTKENSQTWLLTLISVLNPTKSLPLHDAHPRRPPIIQLYLKATGDSGGGDGRRDERGGVVRRRVHIGGRCGGGGAGGEGSLAGGLVDCYGGTGEWEGEEGEEWAEAGHGERLLSLYSPSTSDLPDKPPTSSWNISVRTVGNDEV
ncbi:hypothetical protein B0H13DRAFT_2288912 [Mycena leptocephala]|nr:hypothetical protein B0H13DRAFT_2288912 [Mycena leptocephala]